MEERPDQGGLVWVTPIHDVTDDDLKTMALKAEGTGHGVAIHNERLYREQRRINRCLLVFVAVSAVSSIAGVVLGILRC